MKVVLDTGPLLAFVDRTDRAHRLSVLVVSRVRAFLAVPDAVVVETYYLLRSRVSHHAALEFLADVRDGAFPRVSLDKDLFSRAVEYDLRHADLKLGLVDASVMALAEAHDAAILTFDFKAFRATQPKAGGWWKLVIEESVLRKFLS